jgi:hypothetical protein
MFKLLLVVLLSIPYFTFSQNSAVTEFTEKHDTALTLYFYPSTLRMINLERNPEFDEMIREVKKARFFRMDSGAVSSQELAELTNSLLQSGLQELMFIKKKEMDVQVLGIEKKVPETIVISKNGDELMLLEINGMINVAKLPKIMDSFSENAFLNVLDLNSKARNDQRSQNQ